MLVSKHDEIKQSVWADRLKRYRVQMSYKQSALAEQLGVSQPQISRWENAYSAPSLPMQAKIIRVLERAEAQEPWHDVVSFIARTAAVALGISSAGQIRVASLGFAEAAGLPHPSGPVLKLGPGGLCAAVMPARPQRRAA